MQHGIGYEKTLNGWQHQQNSSQSNYFVFFVFENVGRLWNSYVCKIYLNRTDLSVNHESNGACTMYKVIVQCTYL